LQENIVFFKKNKKFLKKLKKCIAFKKLCAIITNADKENGK
jgi:hypothetical protein